jgi:NSS family neurotransmitter:Na+ symporter
VPNGPVPANQRSHWGSRLGFVFAAAGSAVGLGNIWKFPYITGEYGGGAFVLVYLVCIAVVGLPLMYAELIIGRRGGKDAYGAMRDLIAHRGPAARAAAVVAGTLSILGGFLILSFYSVVAGWAIHYLVVAVKAIPADPAGTEATFNSLLANGWLSTLWHTVFMGLTIFVVSRGVHEGIERACSLLMPALAGILVVLLVYVGITGGLDRSISFLFRPDFSKLSGDAILEALGHAFFTLSLGMGAMITYGSYLERDEHVVRDGVAVAVVDTVIALLAGLVIFAVVFDAGAEPGAGPGLVFVTLPALFEAMPGGMFVGIAFFFLLIVAALSSAISLLEVVVAYFVDEKGMSRGRATLGFGFLIWALGVACAFSAGGGVLSFLDDVTTRYTLPIGGLIIAIIAGWLIRPVDREAGFGDMGALGALAANGWLFVIRFLTPVAVLLVILNKMGLVRFGG